MIKIGKIYLPSDFYMIDCNGRSNFPIILGRPLLAMGGTLIKVLKGTLTFHVGGERHPRVSSVSKLENDRGRERGT